MEYLWVSSLDCLLRRDGRLKQHSLFGRHRNWVTGTQRTHTRTLYILYIYTQIHINTYIYTFVRLDVCMYIIIIYILWIKGPRKRVDITLIKFSEHKEPKNSDQKYHRVLFLEYRTYLFMYTKVFRICKNGEHSVS